MKVHQIIEARRNPEQNPKTSINRIVYDALKATKDSIADTKNLFASFTSVDKLGINPKSKYDTPLGIYAYPAEYVFSRVKAERSMAALPFAGDQPYVNLFKAQGNIINVATISAAEVRSLYKRIAELWASTAKDSLGQSWKTSVDEIEKIINNASKKAKFPDYPGGQLWYVTWVASSDLFANAWNTTPPVAWNKLFRSIGVDGCVDYTPEGGLGIIHTSEPTQAVFFAINAVTDNERHANKYSPTSGMLQRKKEIGQEAHEMTKQVVADLKTITDPEDIYRYLMDNKRIDYIRLVKDPDAREYILSKYPQAIGYISKPTPREQLVAIISSPSVIDVIERPNEEAVTLGLRQHPTATFDSSRLAALFPTANKELQLKIVQASSFASKYFTKSYPEVIQHVIKDLTVVYGSVGKIPSFVKKLATVSNVDYDSMIQQLSQS